MFHSTAKFINKSKFLAKQPPACALFIIDEEKLFFFTQTERKFINNFKEYKYKFPYGKNSLIILNFYSEICNFYFNFNEFFEYIWNKSKRYKQLCFIISFFFLWFCYSKMCVIFEANFMISLKESLIYIYRDKYIHSNADYNISQEKLMQKHVFA